MNKKQTHTGFTGDLNIRIDDDGATMASIAAMFGATVEQAAAILARYAVDRQKKQRRNGGEK